MILFGKFVWIICTYSSGLLYWHMGNHYELCDWAIPNKVQLKDIGDKKPQQNVNCLHNSWDLLFGDFVYSVVFSGCIFYVFFSWKSDRYFIGWFKRTKSEPLLILPNYRPFCSTNAQNVSVPEKGNLVRNYILMKTQNKHTRSQLNANYIHQI